MQRHPALQDLSRDHFIALNHVVAAKRILEGHPQAKPLDVVWEAFVAWAAGPLLDHFAEEEELLVPLADGAGLDDLVFRLEADHARLRDSLEGMRTHAPDVQVLCNVAEDLRLHIRWEEERFFEGLQEALTVDQLDALDVASADFRAQAGLPVASGT